MDATRVVEILPLFHSSLLRPLFSLSPCRTALNPRGDPCDYAKKKGKKSSVVFRLDRRNDRCCLLRRQTMMDTDDAKVQDFSPLRSSFSVSTVNDLDEWEDSFSLPPASQTTSRRATQNDSGASDRTPLVSSRKGPSLLFGGRDLHWEGRQKVHDAIDDRPTGLAGFFFGFMYEESCPTDVVLSDQEQQVTLWNRLNLDLFLVFCLTTAATDCVVTLVPTAATDLLSDNESLSAFTSRAAASAVLGTSCGKLLVGPAGDVFGARRVSCIYALLLSLSLLALAFSQSPTFAVWACFLIEFCQSVQWPCMIVILAGHYNRQGGRMYEGGIYVTSLASRFGSLLAIPISSILLRRTTWRVVAQCAALVSFTGALVMFMFVSDSPLRRNDPQNPIRESSLREFTTICRSSRSGLGILVAFLKLAKSVFLTNLVPALRSVLKSGTFWIVAIAHTGSSMVRSSERILGTYFHDTSFATLDETQAGSLVVFLSIGAMLGLTIAGSIFSRRNAKERKRMVSKLYMLTIGACYMLSLLSIPRLRVFLGATGMILVFQVISTVISTVCMGFGIAVQCYQIPGLVGAAFGHNKGLYAAYTDGVAYGLSSGVWRIVGNAVQEGNPQGGGWAYGWAGVALMLVLCAVLMVEFMEHYFVRTCRSSTKQGGGYETIIFV